MEHLGDNKLYKTVLQDLKPDKIWIQLRDKNKRAPIHLTPRPGRIIGSSELYRMSTGWKPYGSHSKGRHCNREDVLPGSLKMT